MSHYFELQVIPRRILEEHRPLFSRLALKAFVGLHDELDSMALQSIPQLHELWFSQYSTEVWHGHFVTINGIIVVNAAVLLAHVVTHDLMAIQAVVLPFVFRATTLLQVQHLTIKLKHKKSNEAIFFSLLQYLTSCKMGGFVKHFYVTAYLILLTCCHAVHRYGQVKRVSWSRMRQYLILSSRCVHYRYYRNKPIPGIPLLEASSKCRSTPPSSGLLFFHPTSFDHQDFLQDLS